MAELSLQELLAEAENPAFVRVATARVLLRQDLASRHAELEAELTAATVRDRGTDSIASGAPAVSRQILELQDEMEAAKREFRFRNIGKRAWADLLAAHPPTKEQLGQIKGLDHNPATFPIAAIAASCTSPKMDEADVGRLESTITISQWTVLWGACIDANLGGADIPKSMAAGLILRASERYASTPVPAASPEASSSDE